MNIADTLNVACPNPKLRAKRMAEGVYQEGESGLEKRCFKCRDYWPADSEFFYKCLKGDGLNNCCKACYIENRSLDRRRKTKTAKGNTSMPISKVVTVAPITFPINHVWLERINKALEENRNPEIDDLMVGIGNLLNEKDTLQNVIVEMSELIGQMIAARYSKDDAGVLAMLDAFMEKRAVITDDSAAVVTH